ncbi:hypothetical protein D3C85_1585190 [compost metagenome]
MCFLQLRRPPGVAIEHRTDGALDDFQRAGLGDETAGTEFTGASDYRCFLLGGDHYHRNLRVLTAQQHQTGEAIGTRHVQVEKDQVPVGALGQASLEFGDTRRFHQPRVGPEAQRQGLLQRAAEQRVVIGDADFV